jgi:3-polyprenyl-4-hydroxybenzoate decarboxylase
MDIENAQKVSRAGGVIMPLSPPFFMFAGIDPKTVSLHDLMAAFVERVLAVLGQPASRTWEDVR